jgi:hypothetical protein
VAWFGEGDEKAVALAEVRENAEHGGEEAVGKDAGGYRGPVGGKLAGAEVGVEGAGDAVLFSGGWG